MVTELQRQQMLAIISPALTDIPAIIKKVKEHRGIDLTEDQVKAAVNQLRQVRGV